MRRRAYHLVGLYNFHPRAPPDEVSKGPRIIGIIAYDSPMLGLNPALFSNTAQQYIDYASAAHDTISSLTGVGLGSLWGSKGGQAAQSTYQKKSQQDQSQVIPPVSAHQAAERDASAGSGGGPSWLTAKSAGAVGGSL